MSCRPSIVPRLEIQPRTTITVPTLPAPPAASAPPGLRQTILLRRGLPSTITVKTSASHPRSTATTANSTQKTSIPSLPPIRPTGTTRRRPTPGPTRADRAATIFVEICAEWDHSHRPRPKL